MRVILSSLIPNLNEAAPDGALVVIVAFFPKGTDENEVYYFTTNNAPVDYPTTGDTHTYNPIPMQFDPEEEAGTGELSSARILIGNAGNVWTEKIKQYKGFPSGKVIVRFVNTDFLNDTTSELSVTFKIERHTIDYRRDAVSFDMRNWSIYKASAPRQKLQRACEYAYKQAQCGYPGLLTTCDHTFRGPNGCEFHDNAARFGGAPGLVRR